MPCVEHQAPENISNEPVALDQVAMYISESKWEMCIDF